MIRALRILLLPYHAKSHQDLRFHIISKGDPLPVLVLAPTYDLFESKLGLL